MTRASAVLVLALAACSTDVLLGGQADAGGDGGTDAGLDASGDLGLDAARDASTDAAAVTPFADGTYAMTISPTQTAILCTGSLSGMESAFSSITRDSLGLVEGTITVTAMDATHLVVTGAPIDTGFLQPSVSLEKGGGPGVPPDVWIGIATRADTGPVGTALLGVELEAHETTITPSGFSGRVGAMYVDLVTSDECTVGFDATFARL